MLKEHRKAFFFAIPLVFALLVYWASRIRFEEDITKLIPASEGAEQVNRVLQTVTFADKIVINITASREGDIASLQAYADALATAMETAAGTDIRRLQVRVEDDQLLELVDLVNRNLPLFLDRDDYRHIDSLLHPDSIAVKVRDTYRAITSPQNLVSAQLLRQDPLGLTYLGLRKFMRLQSGDQFTLTDGYLIARGNKNLIAFITPSADIGETADNARLIASLDQAIQELNTRFSGRATAEYFGAAAMAVANARQIKRDIQITLSIALVALIALFIYFYRRAAIPLIILLPAAFGSLLGMAVLYWLKGTISAISIGIGSVLLGLTLDYSLHILSHYRGTGDVKRLFESTTKPLLMCAVFTAVDFLCLLFLRSDVLKDLGIFAATSVLGAAVFALIFIPQVYTPRRKVSIRQNTFVDAIARYDFSRNNWLLAAGAVLIVISLFTFRRVTFNDDLAALNYQPEQLRQAEQRLDTLINYAAKSIYLVSYGHSYDEAADRNAALYRQLEERQARGDIYSFQSAGAIALSTARQQDKIRRWNQFWSEDKKGQLRHLLLAEGRRTGFKESAFQPFFETLSTPFSELDTADQHILRESFLEEFLASRDSLTTMTTVVKTKSDHAAQLIESLADEQGILAIDRKHLQERLLSNLEADFNTLFFIASIAVFVVLFLFFGSLELTLITNIPIFLGWLVTLGMMGAFGIQFNAFNIIITTLIFGLGVDYSIFVTKGLIEQYTYGSRDMSAYKAGVIMSALATVICFGILAFAKHPAIRSISIIPLIGLLVVVLMSFSVQPWLFRTFISRPQERGNTPWRVTNLIFTGFTFGYFFLGGLAISLLGQLFIPILPLSKKKKFAAFHRLLQFFFHNLMYRTPGVRMNITGQKPDNYDPPAIVIANHTSILDTPTMGLLHPMQIFMMNDRQLRSPFFGRAMRMVGAYPASENHPESLDRLRKKVDQGYSLIIFPEGTRSMTSNIQRFHKGAFYLAEQLKMDILPVLIHGNAHALPKNDNMLKPGPITMKFLPRIKHDDPAFGIGYALRSKQIAAYFRAEFRKLREEEEPADYFRRKLYLNYSYKPRHIQREVKGTFKANKDTYHRLLRLLPNKGRFLHLGCGYGVLSFLLVYDSAERDVTAWDANEEKIRAAQHTYTAHRYPIGFVTDRPQTVGYDVIVISGDALPDWKDQTATARWVVLEQVGEADASEFLAASGFVSVFKENGSLVFKKAGDRVHLDIATANPYL
ncbi:1-acyl-sn-glycerol-3-phosphate acyltransferase [Parapedobacter deserti]|uniref:1-acyl-sn-glycerol-3-phosphate acyltransferase n=1 Tax=Parapedobacter deserti TaxID=1912957 RepID=A0ABV7JRL0_9SPHI